MKEIITYIGIALGILVGIFAVYLICGYCLWIIGDPLSIVN